MPNPVQRVALAICALLAALLLAGAGGGIAAAEPGDPGEPDSTSEPPTDEPEPTSAAPTPEVPKTIVGALQDLLNRPFSIFGNGRIPGEPVVTVPDGTIPIGERERDKPARKPDPPDAKPELEPVPLPKSGSAINVVLPYHPPVTIPIPSIPVPGYETLRLTLDLTDPYTALASIQETTNTINSLLADAYAPYNPFHPPAPEPQPTFKILEEEPVVEAGGGNVRPVGDSSADLPVLQAPAMAPPVRVAPPRPVPGSAPVGAGAQVVGAGTAGVRGPVLRDSVTQPGSTPAGTAPMGRPAPRQGYEQYLRSARTGQLATIAVPGLIGLLALTASGVVTGYRQADSQRYLRAGAARFLQ